MKRILGLDLGVSSIGWAVIETDDDFKGLGTILGMGSRIIMEKDESSSFLKGNGETKCRERTRLRQARRQLDRWQQRRKKIGIILEQCHMNYGDEFNNLSPIQLWELRANAVTQKISLHELGRVITHLNVRRGYKQSKDSEPDSNVKERSEYLATLNNRAKEAEEKGQTPGQYFYEKLKESAYTTASGKTGYGFRIKEKIFPRKSYEIELKEILKTQKTYYPSELTDSVVNEIFDAVFYQRPLKSCKYLVNICEFEGRTIIDKTTGRKHLIGPKVAPVSSPISQVCRLWEVINNIKLENTRNKHKRKTKHFPELPLFGNSRIYAEEFSMTDEERHRVYDFLDSHREMKGTDLLKLLGLKKDDGFSLPQNLVKGIKGNETRYLLDQALSNYPNKDELLKFELKIVPSKIVDEVTGELLEIVSPEFVKQPLYQLWHTVYSISDKEELISALKKKFSIDDPETIDKLFSIDFRGKGFSNKSAKFMCRLIPYLEKGMKYSDACEYIGITHSNSETKEETETRDISQSIELLKKGSLRQPVVEKVLNQMINIVNAIIQKYGPLDKIRVELARELKKNQKEREADTKRNSTLERESKEIADRIQQEYGLKPSRTKIQKYRLWNESNKTCFYCGQTINDVAFLNGIESDREHIIPRSLLFDDSYSNKVCSCRKCNAEKGQMTAYDYMAEKSEKEFLNYLDRVEEKFSEYKRTKGKSGISKTKHDRLLTSRKDIPQDFINRDLRLTQYISRKAIEVLNEVCRNVNASSGSVTSFFRHVWGYDTILEELNLPRYSNEGMTEIVEFTHKGATHTEEHIPGWSKRLDHRHHAIDALTVALTRQGYIQRLNTLNASDTDDIQKGVATLNLEKWAALQPHFTHAEVSKKVSEIAVSFKTDSKFMTISKRYHRHGGKRNRDSQGNLIPSQTQLIPRQALTEQTVYGLIKSRGGKVNIKNLFLTPELIISPKIKTAVLNRLNECSNDVEKAQKSLKKNPIYIDGVSTPITMASVWTEKIINRSPITSIKFKDIDSIVDFKIQDIVRKRFAENGNNDAKFINSLNEHPLYLDKECNIPINRVKCYARVTKETSIPIKRDSEGNAIGYGKYGNNHHVALYETPEGNVIEIIVPYILAVKRKQVGLPVIVEKPSELWDKINNSKEDFSEETLSRLPMPDWKFIISFQRDEMVLLGMSDDEISETLKRNQMDEIFNHLYRVQIVSSWFYVFRRHTDTTTSKDNDGMKIQNFIRCSSYKSLQAMNPTKIKITRIGEIILGKDK